MSRTILFVAPYLPLPANFGGALRIFHLVKTLSMSNTVILLAPVTGDALEEIVQLGQICDVTAVPAPATVREPASRRKRISQLRSFASRQPHAVRSAWNPKLQAVMDRLFQTRSIDLVQYEFPQSAIFRPSVPVPTIIDAHNIEYQLLQRMITTSQSSRRTFFNAAEFAGMRQFERHTWRQSTACIATSAHDATVIRHATGQDVPIVPNGVDYTSFIMIDDIPPLPNNILFAGAMRHGPNAEGAIWFVTEVLPIIKRSVPDITFTIAGADPPSSVMALSSSNVHVTGTVRDIRDFIGRASVAVVPLHSGSGTRLKILEAFAARRPVVSTSVGAEGLDVVTEKHLLLADSARDFANAVLRVLESPELADSIARSGQELACDRYDWAAIAPALESAHTMAIERFRTSRDRASKH